MVVKPWSHHAKYLPIIRETIAKANPKKIWDDFKKCTEGVRLPKSEDMRLVEKRTGEGDASYSVMLPLNESDYELFLLLRKTNGFAGGFGPAEKLIAKILDENLPTFEIAFGDVGNAFSDFEKVMPQDRLPIWKSIAFRLEKAMFDRGYRAVETGTPFEHALIDDAGSGYAFLLNGGKMDFSRQHIPLSIITGKLSLEETATSRELEAHGGAMRRFYGLHDRDEAVVGISLSPISTKTGKTFLMPQAIDLTGLGDVLKEYPLAIAFRICKIPGARLDVTAVEESVRSRFKPKA